jgi:hypothetical protein
MYNIYEYGKLCDEGYSGEAWNVFYEFSDGDEVWGHEGEYADELDAWFKTFDEALDFANECYPDDVMEDKLVGDLAGDATAVTLNIEQYFFEDGNFDMGSETYFRTYERSGDEILKTSSEE